MTILDDDEIEQLYRTRRPTNERELLQWERDFPPNEPSFSRRRVAVMFWASFLAVAALSAIFIAWRVDRAIDAGPLPSAAPTPSYKLEDSRRDRILLNRLATEQERKLQQESAMKKKKAAQKKKVKKAVKPKPITHPTHAKKIVEGLHTDNPRPATHPAPAGRGGGPVKVPPPLPDPNEQRAEAAGHEQGGESATDETIDD